MDDLISLINADPALSRRGIGYDIELGLAVEEDQFLFEISNGKLIAIEKNSAREPVNGFTLYGTTDTWLKFCENPPPPEFHDMFAMLSKGHLTIKGNSSLLMSNLLYITGFLVHVRKFLFKQAPS